MPAFSRVLVASCLAAALASLTLLLGEAQAGKVVSPQTVHACGPTLPPRALCPLGKTPYCQQHKSVVRAGKKFDCCIAFGCWPTHPQP
jgi:hypothetical protein